jgi:glycosyltransferase involved in cell wall biosynthesis
MTQPRISFLVPDVSAPSIGVAVRMADLIRDRYEVEIVGPRIGADVCPMYRHAAEFKVVPCPRLYRWPDYRWESRKLGRAISGDVIFTVKAFADTLLVALREKRLHGKKVVAYLDEWDAAVFRQLPGKERWRRRLLHAHHVLDELYHPWVERHLPQADAVVSSTTFLQKKFGGQIIPMAVDCNFFRPQPPDQVAALKKSLGLDGRRLLVFGGVVRPHKGVREVLDALVSLNRAENCLLVAGPLTMHLQELMGDSRYSRYIRCAGAPLESDSTLNWGVHRQMPLYLDLADIIVVPLSDTLLARSQMPCKVFEAMAMAKPVIGSAVSDLPLVLDRCGWTVPSGDAAALGRAIQHVFDHSSEAQAMGKAAREKCIRLYSREVTARALVNLFEPLARAGSK